MHVRTPVADMEINFDRLVVEEGMLVATNSRDDMVPARVVIGPGDVRRLFGAFLRPRVVWYLLTSLARSDGDRLGKDGGPDDEHPSPVSW